MCRVQFHCWCALQLLVACSKASSSGQIDEGVGGSDDGAGRGLGGGGSAQSKGGSAAAVDSDEGLGGAGELSTGNGTDDDENAGSTSAASDASMDETSDDAAAGASGESGAPAEGGSGGQGGGLESCPEPAGDSVIASTYLPPATTAGCNFGDLFGAVSELSATLASEADFLEFFDCPEEAASGIDFGARRLRASVVREAGFSIPTREHAVLASGVVTLGFELPVYCGGAFPPTAVVLTLLPVGTEEVQEAVCRTGSCGAGGFPP